MNQPELFATFLISVADSSGANRNPSMGQVEMHLPAAEKFASENPELEIGGRPSMIKSVSRDLLSATFEGLNINHYEFLKLFLDGGRERPGPAVFLGDQ